MNIWDFSYNKKLSFDNIELCNSYLLNHNTNNFDDLEKFIYDIALFHLNNLKIELNEEYYIEFWIKQYCNDLTFHIDCDEFLKKQNIYNYPLLSCVSYLSNSLKPLLITDITLEEKKFKKFTNKNKIKLYFPKENNQITFNPKNFHGLINFIPNDNNFSRNIIAINLWDKKPNNIKYYNSTENKINNKIDNLVKIKNINSEIELIILKENLLNFNFYENLLYDSNNFIINNEIYNLVYEKIKENKNCFEINYISQTEIEKINTENTIINNNLKETIIMQINEMNTIKNINNRFLQRFVCTNIYSNNICEWIINQAEEYATLNNGWTINRHINYPTTDIPIEKITSIFPFIIFSLKSILEKINDCYYLSNLAQYDILDLFIVKYNENDQSSLNLHRDGSFLTFNIALNDPNTYEGGGTFFIDGIQTKLNQGDMLIHCGLTKHAGIKLVKGTRYLLVGFVNMRVL